MLFVLFNSLSLFITNDLTSQKNLLRLICLPKPIILIFSIQVDELLKQRDTIHSTFSVMRTIVANGSNSSLSNGSSSKVPGEDPKAESPADDGGSDGKDKSAKKKWFNLNLKGSADKKLG